MKSGRLSLLTLTSLFLIITGCTPTEVSRRIETQDTEISSHRYYGPKADVALGKVINRSAYLTGIFSDGNDRLGAQATQMLVMHLDRSGRFNVLDRQNLDESQREANFRNTKHRVQGAKYLITGVVTEFGRKETGSVGLGGLISRSKQQILYAKVSLSVLDPVSSKVLGSYAGAGEYALKSKEVLGFGSRAGYDGTLADKVLDLAMREAVDKLAADYETTSFK